MEQCYRLASVVGMMLFCLVSVAHGASLPKKPDPYLKLTFYTHEMWMGPNANILLVAAPGQPMTNNNINMTGGQPMMSNNMTGKSNMTEGQGGMKNNMTEGQGGMKSNMTEGQGGMKSNMTEGQGGMKSNMTEGEGGMKSSVNMTDSGGQGMMSSNMSAMAWGSMYVFDSPLRTGPESKSKALGHSTGTAVVTSMMKSEGLYVTADHIFDKSDKYNGSRITVIGTVGSAWPPYELLVPGGLGYFSGCRGSAKVSPVKGVAFPAQVCKWDFMLTCK